MLASELPVRLAWLKVFFHFMQRYFAFFAHDKRFSLFDPYNRNKKDAEIMIHPFKISPGHTA
jgi:hypothetical protein